MIFVLGAVLGDCQDGQREGRGRDFLVVIVIVIVIVILEDGELGGGSKLRRLLVV